MALDQPSQVMIDREDISKILVTSCRNNGFLGRNHSARILAP